MYSVNEMQGISRISQHFLNIEPKQEQLQAVSSYVSGKDTVLVAPTGFGKSLIYLFISLGLAPSTASSTTWRFRVNRAYNLDLALKKYFQHDQKKRQMFSNSLNSET